MPRAAFRLFLLLVVSVLGMSLLGVAAYTVATIRDPFVYGFGAGAVFAAIGGAGVGLLSSPFVIGALFNAHLTKSLPRVYSVSMLFSSAWAMILPYGTGMTAAVPALICVIIVSGRCGHQFQLPRPSVMKLCPECRYNLSNLRYLGCPECGWGRE